MPQQLLTPQDAAKRLAVSEKTLQRWRRVRTGPPWIVVGGRSIRYSPNDLDAFIAERRRMSSGPDDEAPQPDQQIG